MAPHLFKFQLEKECHTSAARVGILETAHGKAQTPVFMPVATHAAVRGIPTDALKHLQFPILLANTYHLLLRPGPAVFEKFGGIHDFMQWPGAVLTDSGGYQIFSLSRQLHMTEEGASFRSYINGKKILLTPEVSIAMQRSINSNIMMVLDHCLPAGAPPDAVLDALNLTHRWAARSLAAKGSSKQALFAIVQGGCIADLRAQSAAQLTAMAFDGFAIGGVAVGEDRTLRDDTVRFTAQLLPKDKPRYLMGVGTPLDLLEGVHSGIDMFDCILPTALAQQGTAFTDQGKIDLRRGVYQSDQDPIEKHCLCTTCKTYSKAYLHHLHKTGEFLGGTLIGIHNLHFYKRLMAAMRQEISDGSFEIFYQEKKVAFAQRDVEYPVKVPGKRRLRKPPHTLGKYQLQLQDTWASIAQIPSGEVMHSVSDPMVEATRLYLEQSQLSARLTRNTDTPLILWDVGLGAGTNAMAAILAGEALAKNAAAPRPLHLISFENDLDALRLALKHANHFPYLRHPAPHTLLKSGAWHSKNANLNWQLRHGDFQNCLKDAPAPHIIFFDPFSYKTDHDMWTLGLFENLFDHAIDNETELFTYSASTQVRAALLAAGFYVAKGVGTGPKAETTIALKGLGEARKKMRERELLGTAWLERWQRSEKQIPLGVGDQVAGILDRIRNHPQFQT